MRTTIITDGSANNNTGRGGWAAIVRSSSRLVELSGCSEETTSNRMELMAAIEGLRSLSKPTSVDVVTDSAYLCNTVRQKWYERWFTEEEVGTKSKPRPNMDLWRQLVGLLHFHDVQLIKVKGHSGDYWNERADRLAAQARQHQYSLEHVIQDWEDGLRCQSRSESAKHCKLHLGHAGQHHYSMGSANGVEPYGR